MKISTRLERKDPRLPVFVVIQGRDLKTLGLVGTTVIEGTANACSFGRRTIKAWGKGSDDWFVEFTSSFCKMANLNVGDSVIIEFHLADASTPADLENLLSKNKGLAAAWQALSDRQRREANEYIRAAKTQATRERRAASIAEDLRSKAKT